MTQHTIPVLSLVTPSAGRDVQDGIRRIEGTIDEMLADSATLLAKTLRASTAAGLAPAFGQKALQRQLGMIEAGMKLRELAFTAHQDMRVALRRIDTDVVGWGDLGTSPLIDAGEPAPAAQG